MTPRIACIHPIWKKLNMSHSIISNERSFYFEMHDTIDLSKSDKKRIDPTFSKSLCFRHLPIPACNWMKLQDSQILETVSVPMNNV